MSTKGYKQTEGHKRKIGLANKKSIKILWTDVDHREKMRLVHKGKIGYWLGKKRPELLGEKNPRWKGGYKNHLMHNKNRRIMKLNATGSHTLIQWEELKMRFDYMCLCCKKHEPKIVLSEDHIIPLSKGGTDNIENIQPLCKSCNASKGNRRMTNYIISPIQVSTFDE